MSAYWFRDIQKMTQSVGMAHVPFEKKNPADSADE